MSIEAKDDNFEEEVLKSDKPVLVDFWAPWCGPCQAMGPVIEEISKEFEDKVKVVKVNVDNSPQFAQKYGIMSIPALIIFKNGEIYKQLEPGVHSKEKITEELNNLK